MLVRRIAGAWVDFFVRWTEYWNDSTLVSKQETPWTIVSSIPPTEHYRLHPTTKLFPPILVSISSVATVFWLHPKGRCHCRLTNDPYLPNRASKLSRKIVSAFLPTGRYHWNLATKPSLLILVLKSLSTVSSHLPRPRCRLNLTTKLVPLILVSTLCI